MKSRDGFTLAEILVVSGVMATLFGFTTLRLLGVQHKPQLSTVVDTVVSDIKSQQIRAMTGDGSNTGAALTFGIAFTQTQYTLFRGQVYSPSDPGNFNVTLLPPIEISTTFPGGIVVFGKGSGEVAGFVNGSSTVTVRNTASNEQKTLLLNNLGTIVSVQ